MSRLVVQRRKHIPKLSRFAWLMALYAENHTLLTRLFAADALTLGSHVSSIGDGLDIRLDVLARHAYTLELRISYAMVDPVSGMPDPSAHLRLYRDARQVEASHCYVGRRWQDVLGMHPSPEALVDHRMRMNTFLGKWLHYLAEGGHGIATLRADTNHMPMADCA